MFWKHNQKKQVLNATHIECPSCNELATVKAWESLAKGTYGNVPDIRKASFKKSNSFPFQCPECYKGYSAHLLKFHNNSTVSLPHIAATSSKAANQ